MRGIKGKPVVIAVSQYPGGADTLVPVLQLLLAENKVYLSVIASDYALDIFRSAGIPVNSAEGFDFRGFFETRAPALLITDLVGKNASDLHYVACRAAKKTNVRILGVLDSWMNYPDRVKDPLDNVKLGLMPDKLAVMNQYAADELVNLGVPVEIIAVTGQPAFDKTYFFAQHRQEIREKVEAKLNIGKGRKLVVFFSENIEEMYGGNQNYRSFLGYTQHTAIAALLEGVEKINASDSYSLLIKRHPREKEPFRKFFLYGQEVRQVSAIEVTPLELAVAADVNCGMSSIMLVHSYLLKKPTLSIVPGILDDKNLFALSRAGALKALITQQDIDLAVKKAILEGDCRNIVLNYSWYNNDGLAGSRVVQEAYKIIIEEVNNG